MGSSFPQGASWDTGTVVEGCIKTQSPVQLILMLSSLLYELIAEALHSSPISHLAPWEN